MSAQDAWVMLGFALAFLVSLGLSWAFWHDWGEDRRRKNAWEDDNELLDAEEWKRLQEEEKKDD